MDPAMPDLERELPQRAGPRPRTTATNPHAQLDQRPDPALWAGVLAHGKGLPEVSAGPSGRAPAGTTGFHLTPAAAAGPAEAFLLGTEFAHVHPLPEGSLHLTLPPGLREAVIARGWAEPHPLAGRPTISAQIVLVYAPRDAAEERVVNHLVTAAWRYARGPA